MNKIKNLVTGLRITIATSIAITFTSSIGATIGKIMTGQVDYLPADIVVVAITKNIIIL